MLPETHAASCATQHKNPRPAFAFGVCSPLLCLHPPSAAPVSTSQARHVSRLKFQLPALLRFSLGPIAARRPNARRLELSLSRPLSWHQQLLSDATSQPPGPVPLCR
ncbi:hypothetical protein BV20DRAFT_125237 [Pilatotrama ljubarskyi]|nr:hypothetical protein BV20DRAFT_125237 [Pilatotrama ljubarskyi]